MAGGPLFAHDPFPVTSGSCFPSYHVGAGSAGVKRSGGLGVAASIAADAVWELEFLLPPTLPSGTLKLRLIALANATSGSAKVNPKWASVAVGEDPNSATLNAEGTTTLTWSSGDNDDFRESKITLDADTAVAGEVLAVALTFETSGWTLAVTSTWIVSLIWE